MITRRAFLGTAGVLVVSVSVPGTSGATSAAGALAPTVFVRVDRRGRVVATVPKPDAGQGVRTMAAVLVAEELAVEVADVALEQAPGDTATYGSQAVANSSSSRQLAEPLRTAAATARCLLVAAAAARWGVPPEECVARAGRVEHPRRKALPYRVLVSEAAALDPATVPVTLTPPERWRLIGRTRAGRADARDIVTGRARYGIDAPPSGSLVAVVARPPWLGALVSSAADAAALAVPGVVAVVRLDPPAAGQGGVAVIASSTAAALRGRDALRVGWTGGTPAADSREWLAGLESALPAAPAADVRRVYRLPLLAHAPMEPMNATAHVTATGAEVWAPTQDPGRVRTQVARQLGLPESAVRVTATLAGGAFGRRIETDPVLEAVACARAAGRPVTVRWTRDDDTRHDSYRPMSVHRLSATLDADGLPVGRSHQVATWPLTVNPAFDNPAIVRLSGNHFPYAVPGDVSVTLRPAPLRTGFWRAVYAGQFGYAEECFLGEVARRGGHDQVDVRRRLLPEDSRLRRVLDVAAERAGRAGSSSRGVACHLDYGSAIAVIADADPGTRRVVRVHAAVDVGVAVHPSGVVAQVEGGVLDALSTVLGAQITVRDGAVVQSSFRDYPWARIGDCPDIDVRLVPSTAPIGGLGELAYPPAAAAIASALAEGGDPVTGMPYGAPVG
ncbi:xanthine dehydrogenase family protein molybdopterin-binding subunit [Actinophytocola algeriensis]|uniref:Isoquinoline 1-oxidoreductase beta subunit n=1 Tax=Actinophytocola algeriensis TaxID=1768010 RepID=A0A7W7VCI7_9PSEU|nr:molybdopterin cofactor-binding domain-containing protein [Actinophytocola algeriensis]MBB4905116.1 isoquinoline 1-oxidoreductase beta subunit [Actinophytocola algeriensis]MBE1473199.1 isoquinoline 1-oxidoreductase beta subunit [Actinophytocola algeriensis]